MHKNAGLFFTAAVGYWPTSSESLGPRRRAIVVKIGIFFFCSAVSSTEVKAEEHELQVKKK